MKKLAALLMLLCILAVSVPAVADDYIGNMEVINCNEWVSLREWPDTSAKRLLKVSLGAIVSNCRQVDDEWIYAEYDGYSGYILAEYLQPSDGRLTFSAMMITILDGAPFYATIDSTEPIDCIPANTIVRNCSIMDNDRVYVEWGTRCGFISLLHAEVYNEMMHYPLQLTFCIDLYSGADEDSDAALWAVHLQDFPIKEYDYTYFEYEDYLLADDLVPKLPFVLCAETEIGKVHLFSLSMTSFDSDSGEAVYEATLDNIQYQMDPEHPMLVGAVIWGDTPNLAVGYEHSQGVYHFAFIEISGEDGRLMLREF